MLGKLPEDLSAKMLEKYTAEQKEFTAQAEQYRKARMQEKQDEQDVEKFIQRLKKWSDAPCLTRELCLDLIEFIVVHARPEDWNCQEMCSQRIPKILDRQESGSVVSQPS